MFTARHVRQVLGSWGIWGTCEKELVLVEGVSVGVTRAKHNGECVETVGRSGRSGKGFKREGGCCGIWNL